MANALHGVINIDVSGKAVSKSAAAARWDAPRNQAYADWMEFIAACFDLGRTHPSFAVIAAEDKPEDIVISKAIEAAAPVLAEIGDSLDSQAEELAIWNIRAAGKNQIIRGDIQRNWLALEKLGWVNPND